MAKGVHKPLAGTEEAKRGGRATRDKYGIEFYRAIGRRGGETTKTTHGSEHYHASGKLGGEVLKAQRGSEYYRNIARLRNQAAPRARGRTAGLPLEGAAEAVNARPARQAQARPTRRSTGRKPYQATAEKVQRQLARKRQAMLAALPPSTHVSFSQKHSPRDRQTYWYAARLDRETGKVTSLYLGKERPQGHPCLDGTCTHRFRHHQPKIPTGRSGRPIGYRPSPESIERMRQAHLGKSTFARKQAERALRISHLELLCKHRALLYRRSATAFRPGPT